MQPFIYEFSKFKTDKIVERREEIIVRGEKMMVNDEK
jgi:chorismate-pyruvate lyase